VELPVQGKKDPEKHDRNITITVDEAVKLLGNIRCFIRRSFSWLQTIEFN
jgi:hypothetical protein